MINWTLFKREMKGSFRLLIIFVGLITLYVSVIISMYNPEMMKTLESISKMMPELMASLGMNTNTASLIGFMVSYLYGFILLLFPMLFCILRGHGLVAKYVDQGSMAILVAAPVRRVTIVLTQTFVLLSGIVLLVAYTTILEFSVAQSMFPGELALSELLPLNAGLLCLHFFIGGICFLASCLFSETKYSIGFGAGIPTLMYVLQMLANAGDKAKAAKYFSLFTLFDPYGILAGEAKARIGVFALLIGAAALYAAGITIFTKKDLHI